MLLQRLVREMAVRYKREQELMLAKIIEAGNATVRAHLGSAAQRAEPTAWLHQQRKNVSLRSQPVDPYTHCDRSNSCACPRGERLYTCAHYTPRLHDVLNDLGCGSVSRPILYPGPV